MSSKGRPSRVRKKGEVFILATLVLVTGFLLTFLSFSPLRYAVYTRTGLQQDILVKTLENFEGEEKSLFEHFSREKNYPAIAKNFTSFFVEKLNARGVSTVAWFLFLTSEKVETSQNTTVNVSIVFFGGDVTNITLELDGVEREKDSLDEEEIYTTNFSVNVSSSPAHEMSVSYVGPDGNTYQRNVSVPFEEGKACTLSFWFIKASASESTFVKTFRKFYHT